MNKRARLTDVTKIVPPQSSGQPGQGGAGGGFKIQVKEETIDGQKVEQEQLPPKPQAPQQSTLSPREVEQIKKQLAEAENFGAVKDNGTLSKGEKSDQGAWTNRVREAVQKSGTPGKGASMLDKYLFELLKPKIDWRKELKRYLNEKSNKFDYKLPSRRFASSGIYIPGQKKLEHAIKELVIAVDTSLSVSKEELDIIFTEIQGMAKKLEILNIRILLFTVDVYYEYYNKKGKIDNAEILKHFRSGGTDFQHVFDYIDKKGIKPGVLVFFTDGGAEAPTTPTYSNDVLWAITYKDTINQSEIFGGKVIHPFGKIIYIDVSTINNKK